MVHPLAHLVTDLGAELKPPLSVCRITYPRASRAAVRSTEP